MKILIETTGFVALTRKFEVSEQQVAFATALALTRTAEAARVAVQQEMTRVFDRPTPFTLRALRIVPATKSKLEAQVLFKDLGGKSLADAKTRYGQQVFGGQRVVKAFERRLRKIGLLGVNEEAVPGQGARLDAYGNMQRSQIVQILSWFEAFGEAGYTANSTAETRRKRAEGTKQRRGERYFLKRDKPGRGIYRSVQTGFGWVIQPVLMFVRRSSYRRRLDFDRVVEGVVREQLPRWFADAAKQAMRSAR